jgi:hypothetical protein
MRLISFLLNNTACYGAVHGNKVLNLTPILGAQAPDLKTLIAKKMLAQAADALSKNTPDLIFEDLSLLPVIPNPEKIMCVGLNYHDHVKETGRELTEKPAIFSRVNASQVGMAKTSCVHLSRIALTTKVKLPSSLVKVVAVFRKLMLGSTLPATLATTMARCAIGKTSPPSGRLVKISGARVALALGWSLPMKLNRVKL